MSDSQHDDWQDVPVEAAGDAVPTSMQAPGADDWQDVPVDTGSEIAMPVEPGISKTESTLRGAGQGVTAGFQDEGSAVAEGMLPTIDDALGGRIAATGQALSEGHYMDALKGLFQGKSQEEQDAILDAYKDSTYSKRRDEYRKENADAQAANPKSYLTGEIGGAALSSVLPGMNVSKGASFAKAVGQSALQGGLTAAGQSDADLVKGEYGKFTKDVAKGTAIGGGMGAAGYGVQKALSATKGVAKTALKEGEEAVENAAEGTAGKVANKVSSELTDEGSVGLTKLANASDDLAGLPPLSAKAREIAGSNASQAAGVKGVRFDSPEEYSRFGRDMMRRGIVGGKDSANDIARKSAALLEKSGNEIGEQFMAHDIIATQLSGYPELKGVIPKFNPIAVAEKAQSELLPRLYKADPDLAAMLAKKVDHLKSLGSENIKLMDINDLKKFIGQKAYSAAANKENAVKDVLMSYERLINGEIENTLQKTASPEFKKMLETTVKMKGPVKEALEKLDYKKFLAAKKDFALAKMANNSAVAKAGKEASDDFLKMGDLITGYVAGASSGSATLGAGAAVSKAMLRGRGDAVTAGVLNKVADLIEREPGKFGKFARPLAEAAARSTDAVAAKHFVLSQTRPDYRETDAYKQLSGQQIPDENQ